MTTVLSVSYLLIMLSFSTARPLWESWIKVSTARQFVSFPQTRPARQTVHWVHCLVSSGRGLYVSPNLALSHRGYRQTGYYYLHKRHANTQQTFEIAPWQTNPEKFPRSFGLTLCPGHFALSWESESEFTDSGWLNAQITLTTGLKLGFKGSKCIEIALSVKSDHLLGPLGPSPVILYFILQWESLAAASECLR